MNKLDLIDQLSKMTQGKLPGQDAQFKMAAYYRNRLDEKEIAAKQPKIGAVMVLLVWKEEQWQITLMKRPPYDGTHGGQVSFFGGKVEEQDETLMDTAIREAGEEGGFDLEQINFVGPLSPLYIQASNFLVHPFIFYSESELNFNPDTNEVESIFFIPLLTYFKHKGDSKIILNSGFSFDAPAYLFEDKIIWGATAMMLSELEEIIKLGQFDQKSPLSFE